AQREKYIGKIVPRRFPIKNLVLDESVGLMSGILGLYLPEERQAGQLPKLIPYLIRGAKSTSYSLLPMRRRTVLAKEWTREAALVVLSRLSGDLVNSALKSADNIDNDDDRADILYALIPRLPKDSRAQLLADEITRVQSLNDKDARTNTISSLIGYLPKDDRQNLAESLLKHAQISHKYPFASTAKLIPYLEKSRADDVVHQALAEIRRLNDPRSRHDRLSLLIPSLPKSEIAEA